MDRAWRPPATALGMMTALWMIPVLGLALVAGSRAMAETPGAVRAHLGHILTAWSDAPDGKGLLPAAEEEARIARQHAELAGRRLDDLEWMKTHIRHVLNAIDPTLEAAGPGRGYGVFRAADGVAAHIGFAASADGASENVRSHAHHIATAAGAVSARAREIAAKGGDVLSASDPEAARPHVEEIQRLAAGLVDGIDADGDGRIGWREEEGGLAQIRQHLGFLMAGEGLELSGS